MGLGWQVIAAARVQENGGGLEEMLAAAEWARQNMVYYISLDTIEYLSKGGRISEAAKYLDSILRIKPLINVRPETGTVGASMPARSRKAAIEGLYKEFFRHVHRSVPAHDRLAQRRPGGSRGAGGEGERGIPPGEIFISIVSPVLGVHTGPRAIALCGYGLIQNRPFEGDFAGE